MNYVVVGLNHKTAPVELREKVVVSTEGGKSLLKKILNEPPIDEVAVLSTCNRLEFYGSTKDTERAREVLADLLVSPLNGQSEIIRDCLYCKIDKEAVSHLFEVTASLDSQVVGENQITGQVREAYVSATEQEATGYYLGKLFDSALSVAGRVKSETKISQGNVSIGSAGVTLAKKIFGDLNDKSVLLLGAGEIGELVVKSLNGRDVRHTHIVNRSFEKAKYLEEQGLGVASKYEDLDDCLLNTDVFITSVSTVLNEFDPAYFQNLMKKRKNKALFIIDLGMPRNIPGVVGQIDSLYLYNIDDLKLIADENQKQRKHQVEIAKNLIDEEVSLFYEKYLDIEIKPALEQLGKKFEEIRKLEVSKTLRKMPELNQNQAQMVDKLSQVLINKVLHDPILSLKNREKKEKGFVNIFTKIFRLDDEEKG